MTPVKRKKVNKPVSICCTPAGRLVMLDADGNIWEWDVACQTWWRVIDKSKTLESINK